MTVRTSRTLSLGALIVTNPRKAGWWRWLPRFVLLGCVAGPLVGGLAGLLLYAHFARELPELLSVEDYKPATVSRFYADDGRLVAEYAVERRRVVPLERMPPHLIEAVLASEDKRYFEHGGVDPRATVRALLANFVADSKAQGASTITQQLCKTLVGREKSYARKAKEAILARRTEAVLTKLEILYLYLNEIYLGHGAYGVAAAARLYFGKDVEALSLAESAMLAGLPPQPGRLNPVTDLKRAKARQAHVLKRMVAEGFVSQAEADGALAEPLNIVRRPPELAKTTVPYYVEHARTRIQRRYGYDALNRGGLKVYLAVDADLQRLGQDALQRGLRVVGKRQGYVGSYKFLKADQISDFLSRLTTHYQGPARLKPERHYLGVVTAVSKSVADVSVGQLVGRLPLKEGMRWARARDVESSRNSRRLRDITTVLAVGDVVSVRLNADPAFAESKIPILALEQVPPVQGALVSFQPGTGYVKAMVGGYDFDQSEYNRAFQGCRQPGSIFKPIVYGLGFQNDLTLASPIADTPITVYDSKSDHIWKPKNYGGQFKGEVIARDALIRSMNLPAIRVIERVGAKASAEFAGRLGISTPMYPDRSLVLGSSCVYPWEMTRVFGVFAERGRMPRAVFVKRVEDRDGNILEDRTHFADPWAPTAARVDGLLRALFEPRTQVMDAASAYLVQSALRDVARAGTATKTKALGLPVGGKTGTTDAYDAWFVGFSSRLVTGVWIGSDRNKRKLGRHETGGKAALPVWMAFMKGAHEGATPADFTDAPPEGIVFKDIDRATGLLAPPGNRALKLPFRTGTEPTEYARRAGSFGAQDIDMIESRF